MGRRSGADVQPCHHGLTTHCPRLGHLQRGLERVSRESCLRIVGVRPDDRDLPDVSAKRQRVLLVLEQSHRFGGEPLGQVDSLAGYGADLDRVFGDVRVVEKAESKLVAQYVAYRAVKG